MVDILAGWKVDFFALFRDLFKKQGFKFKLYGSYLSDSEIFSESGLITALIKRADRSCNICYGYGLGVSFTEDNNAILNERVSFDDITPSALRLYFIYNAVLELRTNEESKDGVVEIPLDDILYSM